MRRLIISFMIVFMVTGCIKRWTETGVYVTAANWTSNNKVVFVKEVITWQCEKIPPFISERADVKSDEFYLCEINYDGTGLREICYLWDRPGGIGAISSAGDWIVFSDNIYREIYVIRRDGSGLQKIGSGINPDFSPDASQIVYEKPDSGIWIMNRDGSNDHQISEDEEANQPAWGNENNLISYLTSTGLIITDITGNILFSFSRDTIGDTVIAIIGGSGVDWGPLDSLIVSGSKWKLEEWSNMEHGFLILHIDSILTLRFKSFEASSFRWSPDGEWLIGCDKNGYFVIKRDGTNKWYLKDKIQGGEQ